jgi:hypothetical protein
MSNQPLNFRPTGPFTIATDSTKVIFLAEGMQPCTIPTNNPNCPICQDRIQSNALVLYNTFGTQSSFANIAATSPALTAYPPSHAVSSGHPPISNKEHEQKKHITSLRLTTSSTTLKDVPDHTPCRLSCCGNVFGRHCINTWLDKANTCPMCRAVLFRNEEAAFNADPTVYPADWAMFSTISVMYEQREFPEGSW